jgi:hypothetical protein
MCRVLLARRSHNGMKGNQLNSNMLLWLYAHISRYFKTQKILF